MAQFPPHHPLEDVAWRSDHLLAPQDRRELEAIYAQALICAGAAPTDDLGRRISRLKSALASYKKLPPEILSSIFSLSRLDSVYMIPGGVEGSCSCYPEHVCSLWRRISLSTPTLYETVHVRYFNHKASTLDGRSSLNQMAGFAQEIIARGARTLIIDLSCLAPAPSQSVLRQLLAPGPRLKTLIMRHTNSDLAIFDLTLSLLAVMPSTLQYLAIDFSDAQTMWSQPEIFPSSHFTSELPWNTLQDLSLSGTLGVFSLSPATVQLLLSKCPRLQTCKLRMSGAAPDPEPYICLPNQNIVAKKLKHLELLLLTDQWLYPHRVGSLLSSLTLPSLQEMCITGCTEALVKAMDLFDLFHRSRCQLSRFELVISSFSEQSLHHLLQSNSFSTLTKLYLTSPMYPSVLRKIASGELLPRLTYLKGTIDPNAESVEALHHVARARKAIQGEGVAELEVLDFFCAIFFIRPDPPLPPTPQDLAEMYQRAGGRFNLEFIMPYGGNF